MTELKLKMFLLCAAHLPQERNQVLGPGWAVLDTDCTEELNQQLHRVTGMDVIRPLVPKQVDNKNKKEKMRRKKQINGKMR